MTGRERVLAMFEGRAVDQVPLMPITMMFAAHHAGVKYGEYAARADVLVESQLKTAERFGFDYVSAISDPAREASDLGAAIEWFEDQPPAIVESKALLAEKPALCRLDLPDPSEGKRMSDRLRAVRMLRERAGSELVVEGWIEGPCAMGADLRGLNTLMLDFADDEGFVRDLFEFVVAMELRFAKAQLEAGADLIGVGDAAASLVGPRVYRTFVWPYEKKLVDGLRAMGARVRLHICGNTRKILPEMGQLGCEMVDLDYLSPLAEGRAAMGPAQPLCGNLDPVRGLRDGTAESVTSWCEQALRDAGPRWIAGAGCEIPPGTPYANVDAMAAFARGHVG
ncbi:MAG: uroporphyrinogen decarboxylase family protein [Bryobacteraceae bacterium]|nr:uroporphyrinogen decarboxylase family protein [Bryobacteraceae bacterium]